MVGFIGALIGGAAKGWGAGQLENIKRTREEKLRMLELDRAERLETGRQQFESRENALNRQSQERLTTAQLGVQQSIAEQNRLTQERIATAGNISAESIAEGNRLSNENLQKLQNAGAIEVAKLQAETQKAVNSTFIPMSDGTYRLKIGDELRPLGNDPETGKPLMPLVNDDDTNEMKNYKALLATGMTPETARSWAFDKNADPTKLEADIFKTLQSSRPDLGPAATEEDKLADARLAKTIAEGMQRRNTAPAAAADAESTAPEATITIPATMTDEQVKAFIQEALAGNANKEALKAALRRNGRDPKKMGLE